MQRGGIRASAGRKLTIGRSAYTILPIIFYGAGSIGGLDSRGKTIRLGALRQVGE